MDSPSTAHDEHEKDLRWRLSQLTPRDTVRGVFLKGVVEVVRELGDEAAVRESVAYTEGALRAVLENAKVKRFQIRSRQPEPLVVEYDLSWE